MKHTPIFSAVIGNRNTLGFFDVYADLSSVWQHGKTKITGTVSTGTLESYLEIAKKEGKKIPGITLDHTKLPDPLAQALQKLQHEIDHIESKMKDWHNEQDEGK